MKEQFVRWTDKNEVSHYGSIIGHESFLSESFGIKIHLVVIHEYYLSGQPIPPPDHAFVAVTKDQVEHIPELPTLFIGLGSYTKIPRE